MKLIREEIETVDFIVEERNGKKNMFIEGIFLQGDLKNRNGRMYPMETLRREVQRYTENHVNSGRALGELGHPDGPTVNLDRVSHKIVTDAVQINSWAIWMSEFSKSCLLYTSPSPRDYAASRMPSSA